MAKRACVFIVVFLYECAGKILPNNANELWKSSPPINMGIPPAFYDWRDLGMVSPVKDQGGCSACWAFSAVASIESHLSIYMNKKVILSEQFLIDCDKNNAGCNNSSIHSTFANIVADFGGVLLYENYHPYANRKLSCSWTGKPYPVPVVGFRRVYPDERQMMKYLFAYGPLSAAINAASMRKYDRYTVKNGIDQPTEKDCPPNKLDHAVLIVGYNLYVSKDGLEKIPYWVIKNSWGADWGDNGYYYLERGRNACGIESDISFPFVA